jgi:hypothetical protein
MDALEERHKRRRTGILPCRNKPSSTLLNYKAQAVAQKNDTITFMSSIFTEDDYKYIRKVARQWDASGLEKKKGL